MYQETYLEIPGNRGEPREELMNKRNKHIVDMHFYARLTKLVAKYQGQQKCPFDQNCPKNITLVCEIMSYEQSTIVFADIPHTINLDY